jgi:hypothetical protein
VKVIHPHIRPVGSYGSAEVPTWSRINIYDWAKPSRSPIFDVLTPFPTRGSAIASPSENLIETRFA